MSDASDASLDLAWKADDRPRPNTRPGCPTANAKTASTTSLVVLSQQRDTRWERSQYSHPFQADEKPFVVDQVARITFTQLRNPIHASGKDTKGGK